MAAVTAASTFLGASLRTAVPTAGKVRPPPGGPPVSAHHRRLLHALKLEQLPCCELARGRGLRTLVGRARPRSPGGRASVICPHGG